MLALQGAADSRYPGRPPYRSKYRLFVPANLARAARHLDYGGADIRRPESPDACRGGRTGFPDTNALPVLGPRSQRRIQSIGGRELADSIDGIRPAHRRRRGRDIVGRVPGRYQSDDTRNVSFLHLNHTMKPWMTMALLAREATIIRGVAPATGKR